MASYQDNVKLLNSAITKLPSITTNVGGRSSATERNIDIYLWMGALRRQLDHSISFTGQPRPDDIEKLSKELIKFIIRVLQTHVEKQMWLDLNIVLTLIQPYTFFMKSDPFYHYVERIIILYSSNIEKLFDIPILETVKSAFPDCVAKYHEKGSGRWPGTKEKKPHHMASSASPKKLEYDYSFFGGKNPYSIPKHVEDPEKLFRPKQLTLSAIEKSIGSVAIQKAELESVRKSGISSVGVAANIEFPGMFSSVLEEESSSTIFESESLLKVSRPEEETEKVVEFKSISGREAVELFLNHKHMHKVKFVYLNIAKNRHFRPYDLVSVPRDQIEKEHYIFSSFGVLHTYPDGDQSETLSLAEWNKDAVIWNALRKIRFFKDYLLLKMFRRWKANVRMITYLRIRKNLSTSLLHAVPEFGSALLHIFRLIQELSEVQFFPERPAETYQFPILDFATNTQRIKANAKDVLELFFCYSKKVVDATKETCIEQLKFYEDQVRQTKPLYVKESMYLQKMKKKLREENLKKAREMMNRQNQLISLIDQVIAVHLLGLARTSITRFVHNVLCFNPEQHEHFHEEEISEDGSRRGALSPAAIDMRETRGESLSFRPLFSARFVFNKQTCQLEMQPSVTKFKEIVSSSFQQIFDLLCAEAYSMHVREGIKIEKSPERPNTAPASLAFSDDLSTFQQTFDAESNAGTTESSFGASDVTRPRSEKTTATAAKFSTPNPSPRSPKKGEQLGLTDPELTPRKKPAQNRAGKATPNMLLSTAKKGLLGLVVDGNRMNLQYNPLDKKKLIEIFFDDHEISEALALKEEFVNTAVQEVSEFCERQNKWLPVIGRFCNDWNEAIADSYKGRAANECELSLNLIKDWIAQVENMPRFFITSNKLLYVDGRQPHNTLVPTLNSIFKKLVSTIMMEAKQISTNITDEVTDTLKVLKNKDTNMTSFAAYASKVSESMKKKEKMTERVSYTRSIFDVIKINCRQLTKEEEKLHDIAKSSWEAFLFQLKDATNFVANQRPVIMKRLDEMFKELHDAAMNVCLQGSCHPVTDPNADPAEVIAVLQNCINEFQDLRGKISEVNYFHDAICNQFYSIDDIKILGEALYDKLELWQLIKVTKNTIHEWKITPFRKFNTDNVLTKLDEWADKSLALAQKLGHDYPVLAIWQENVEELGKQMPLFKKLGHPAMKTRHWKEIFAGMGETYEPNWTLLVDDLLSLKLTEYASLINKVHQDATSEYTVEKILNSIKKDWENRQFDLAKHIYAVKTAAPDFLDRSSASHLGRKPPVQEKDSDTYVLVGVEKLTRDLTESHVTLQAMFQSRHAYEVKSDAEIWSDTLGQIGEIVNVWIACQEKWMYLNRIFNGDPNIARRFPSQNTRFQVVDLKFREFIDSMLEDSKVLSVLSRRHGQKGWRDLQGDTLRKHLTTCVQMEDEILLDIHDLLDDFRIQFPRLYFVSDADIVRLLGISGNPQAYIPFVRKCFRGAHSLNFSLPTSMKSGMEEEDGVNSLMLDLELHSSRLEATHVIGLNDECMEIDALPACDDATKWLATLEKRIKRSLIIQLQDCIDYRVKNNALMITETFNELCEAEQYGELHSDPLHVHSNWLLKYTLQVVLLTESILWFRELKKFLKNGKKKEVHEELKKVILYKVRQYSNGLVENSSSVAKSSTRLRFQCVLSALTIQAAYHRDLLRSLSDPSVSYSSFEWHKLIKHTAQMVDYSKTPYEVKTRREDGGEQGKMINKLTAVGRCFVEQFEYQEDYGYEYTSLPSSNNKGLCVGMVHTPLTERCMIDMWLTLRQGQCGGLFGPSGVGKSAVLSELAQIFGKLYINQNCSEKASIKSLKRSLCGMVESGAWLCFDHAQRLPLVTLSKLSQHIKDIQDMNAVVRAAADTQYTVRGHDESGNLKRSNSITTLHGDLKDGSATAWQPSVSQRYLNSLKSKRFEDYDARNYMEVTKSGVRPAGSITFDNQLLKCKKGFAVFMSFTNELGTFPDIPDCLRLIYRPTCVTKPDRQKIIEQQETTILPDNIQMVCQLLIVSFSTNLNPTQSYLNTLRRDVNALQSLYMVWLLSAGFYDAFNLSVKLDSMYDMLNNNADHITADRTTGSMPVSSAKLAEIGLRTLKTIIMVASLIANKKKGARSRGESVSSAASDTRSYVSSTRFSRRSELALQCHHEELALVDALLNILPLKLANTDAVIRLKECLRNVFPMSARPLLPGDRDSKLAVAVQQQMQMEGLQHDPEVIDKVCQLHAMLQLNQSVVISGLAGSGKTTLYRLLSKALNSLCNESTMSQIISEEQEETTESGFQDFQHPGEVKLTADTDTNQLAGVSSMSDIFAIDKSHHSFVKFEDSYTRIDVTVLYPNAYVLSDLFGYEKGGEKQGILVKLLKDTMVENDPDGKQDVTEHKKASGGASGTDRRASTAHGLKSALCVKKWLVLDGEILSSWMDSLSCFLDDHKRTSAGKSEDIQLRPNTNVLFECADFASASPAIASRCSIVHCDLPNQWKHIATAWLDTAYGEYAIKQNCIEIWHSLVFDLVPKALHFLTERKCLTVLSDGTTHYDQGKSRSCAGVHEVSSLLSIFSSCLKYFNMTRAELKERMDAIQLAEKRKTNIAARMGGSPTSTSTVTQAGSVKSRMESVPAVNFVKSMNLFGFAFVWAFGGSLLEEDMPAFDVFIREAFYKSRYDVVKFPKYETVFDYFVDDETGQFSLWEDKIDLRPRPAGQGVVAYTPIHQLERYTFLSQCLLGGNHSLMLVGEQGCGKTSLVQNLIQPEIDMTKITISPGLSAAQFQRIIESKAAPAMRQHNLGLMAHPSAIIASRVVEARPSLFFLDDLSCAGTVQSTVKNDFQQNPPLLELLRQILTMHGVYESERILFKSLESEIAVLATCPLPSQCGAGLGHGQQLMSPRLTRHFTVVNFLKPTAESILSIYHHSVQSWLEEFPTYALTRHYDLSQAIIAGAHDLYAAVHSYFKPSPRHPHYVFSLHDIKKVIEGMFLLKPATRGRPIPLRHRGANELFKRPRMAGGQIPGRFRHAAASDDPDSEVLPMMKTIVRLWLHECCRVFQDKLSNFSDKNWFTRTLQDALKKHFCTGPKERLSSPPPPNSKMRVIKTPIPSSGSTPMPLSSASVTESGTDGVPTQDTETIDNMQSDFEVETVTTQATEYFIDDDATSGTSPFLQQQLETPAGRENSSTDKSSESIGSMRQTLKFQATGSASTSTSKGGDTTVAASTSSGKVSSSQTYDLISETTTQAQQHTTDTDGDESRALTAMTGDDDDAQSAITGYTTEVESIFETEGSLNDTSESESATLTSASKSSKDQTPIPIATVIQPSAGNNDDEPDEVEMVGKKERPSFGRSKISRPGGAKFGVTFVPGLVEQEEVPGQSAGPLVPFDQILGVNESPSAIIFCQAMFTSPNLPDRTGDMYSEVFEIDLARGLRTCRDMFNSSVTSHVDRLELAFFGQAIRHAARLSRALCLERGHTFLMSSSPFKGRYSLTRLVALFNNARVYVAKPSADKNNKLSMKQQLRRVVKDACHQAGLEERKVVLLIDDEMSKDPKCMDDVCSLMRDGQCPSLYTPKELAEVAASLSPNQQLSTSSDTSILMKKISAHEGSVSDARESTQEKLDKALEIFFSRILSHLHVVVMAHVPVLEGPHDLSPLKETKSKELYFHKNEDLKNFHRMLRRCPDLMTRFACVDLYGEWRHASWRVLAQHYIEDSVDLGMDEMPWPQNSSRLEQVQYISHLLAYIHTDAIARTRASLQNGADRMISPLALRQMVQIFVGIAMDIKYEEYVVMRRLNGALGKVVDTEDAIEDFKQERSSVIPKLHEAREAEQSWKSIIEQQRQEYSEARDRCSQEEEVIKALDSKVEDLKEKSEISFGQLHPMYDVAVAAQDTLEQSWLDEVKRYKAPPRSAVDVVLCLCEMFNVSPASWDNGKILISRENFYDDMVFYDKDNIPEDIFQKIEARIKKPKFRPKYIEKGSLAAAKLCKWIHSIYRYAKKVRDMLPNMNALTKAEKNLLEAQAILGSKRVRCIEIKENLDNQILKYKNASAAAKMYEKALKQLNTQVERATFLRETMREHSERWNEQLRDAHFRLDCAVGDAIIVAACVTYFGQFATEQKIQALKHWTQAAKFGYIDNDSGGFEIDYAKSESEIERISSGNSDTSGIDFVSAESSGNPSIVEDAVSSSDTYLSQNHYFVRVRDKVTPINYLLTTTEQRNWYKSSYPRDQDTRFNGARLYAMTVFQNCSWIFLFDPDNQASLWISASMKKMRETLKEIEREKYSYDDELSGVTSVLKSEKLEIVGDDDDEGTLRACSELDGSGTETQVTIRVSTAGTNRIVSRASVPEVDMRKATPCDLDISDKKNGSVTEEKKKTEDTDSNEEEVLDETDSPLYPLDELWVCSANDERFPTVLDSAVTHGAFLLVTNVELATPSNSAILQSIHSIRTFSHRSKGVHFCFRLFLSTAVSLGWAFHKSTPIFSLPLHHFAITDLSLNQNCLEEKLESIVLGQERPEFETQRRLMEADRFHMEEEMDHIQLDLIETMQSVQGNILEDPNIVDVLQTCREGILLTDASLREVKGMESNLLQKKSELVRVSEHGLMLYDSVSSISIIDPLLYHLSASQFISMYQDCLKSNKRTKAKVAATQHGDVMLRSRVIELKQSLTELMLKYVNRKYFQSDIAAFSTLVSLNMLVSTEKLSRKEMEQFLAIPDFHHHDKLSLEAFGTLHKPPWLSDEIWREVIMLEKKYPNRFSGLSKSLSIKAKHWLEYFSSPPMLLAKVPCSKLYELSVGEKALLWKVVQPKKFNQIATDLNASVLGGVTNTVYSFDIDSMLCEIPANIPCVLMLPENLTGSCFLPLHHLTTQAKVLGIQFLEKSALFLDDLVDEMLECMNEGKWLILDDCHLVKRWPEDFVQLLTSFITRTDVEHPGPSIKNNPDATESKSIDASTGSTLIKDTTEASSKTFLSSAPHRDFRLWMITKKSESNITLLPIILMQRAEFIALETPSSHKEVVRKTYHTLQEAARMIQFDPVYFPAKSGPSFVNRVSIPYNVQSPFYHHSHGKSGIKTLILQLSLLFSALLERASFGKSAFSSSCFWTDGESLDALKSIILVNRPKFARFLFGHFLQRHLLDARDVLIVQQLIKLTFVPFDTRKSKNIFAEVLRMNNSGDTIDHIFNTLLQKPDVSKLGLVTSSANEWVASVSDLTESLNDIRMFVSTQRGKPTGLTGDFLLVVARETALKRNLEFLNIAMKGTKQVKMNLGVLSVVMLEFYTGEVERLNTVIELVKTDLELCLAVINSEAELTEEIHSMLECFARDKLANSWLTTRKNLFKFHSSFSLTHFINFLNDRVDLLTKYMDFAVCAQENISSFEFDNLQKSERSFDQRQGSGTERSSTTGQLVLPYNLAVFTRPDLFLRSILQAAARSNQHDVFRYSFVTKFVPELNLEQPRHIGGAFDTIYVDKLRLHKAVYDLRGEDLHYSISSYPQTLPWLQLKAVKKTSRPAEEILPGNNYNCPMWINEQRSPALCGDDDVIMNISIATETSTEEWLMKGVSITCYLGDD